VADAKPPEDDRAQVQKQKALVLAVTGVAAIVGSYLFMGCLLPVIALVVVVVWLVYGGAAAFLVMALPVAAVCLALYRCSNRERR
jgi:hypothetical protein